MHNLVRKKRLMLHHNSVLSSFLQVISLTTHWLHTWVVPQKSSSQEVVVAASGYLMQVAKEFFYSGTWIAA